jgi:hypothetical protein
MHPDEERDETRRVCERWSKSEPDELISTTLDVLAREYFAKTIREEQEKSSRQRAVDPDYW